MAEPKTRPNKDLKVADFIAAVPDEVKRADCKALVKMMQAATGAKPVMWGTGIVGFGNKPIRYANGTQLDWPAIAFAPRKNDLTVYIMPGFEKLGPQLKKLGKHKTARVCLHLKRLSDIDLAVLQKIIDLSC
jgi:hypothetical protein